PRNKPAPEKAARCATRASISVCGSAQAWPQMIPSPGRITLARSITGAIMTDEKCLDVILRTARTHNVFTDRPVSDATLRQAHELMKWGPTSANSQPGRFIFVRSRQAKEKLRPALSETNRDKTMQAPLTAIVAYDTRFYEHLPRTGPASRSFTVHSPGCSRRSRVAYSPGFFPGRAFTGLMLCAIGMDGMSAPTLTFAPESGSPPRLRRITQS